MKKNFKSRCVPMIKTREPVQNELKVILEYSTNVILQHGIIYIYLELINLDIRSVLISTTCSSSIGFSNPNLKIIQSLVSSLG